MNKYDDEEALYLAAKKQVKKKKGFYGHLASFLAVGFFFLTMNLLTSPHETWWPFPLLPWSIGLIMHYLSVFGFPFTGALSEEWEIRETSKEMRRLSGDTDEEQSSNIDETDYLDLKEIEKQKRNWNDGDLV